MTEKKVNLRLAAVGGDKLKGELISIGKEGRQALTLIEQAGPGASSGLNMTGAAATELMGRLETLASRAARAAANMNSMAGSGAGVMARINAATGVSSGMSRDAEDFAAYGRALDDIRAKFNPLFAEQRRHAEAVAEIDRAYKTGAISMAEWDAATRREIAANAAAAASIRQRQAAFDNFVNTGLRDSIDRVTGVSGSLARTGDDIAAYGRALDETRAKYNPMFAAISRYRSELAAIRQSHAAGAISADEMAAAISRLRRASLQEIAVVKGRAQGYEQMEKAGGMARFQMVQLGYQLNDIGVSLAGGQNPLIVMVQQGAQIQQIYGNGNGGVSAMFQQIGNLIRGLPGPLKGLAIGAAIGAAAIKGIQEEINETSKVQVTFGDTALAVWQVFAGGIYEFVKPAIDFIGPYIQTAWDGITAGVKMVGNAIINGFKLAFLTVETLFKTLPAIVGAAVIGAANAVLSAIETLITMALAKLQGLIDGVGGLIAKIPGMEGFSLGTIAAPPAIPKIDNPFAGQLETAWSEFEGRYKEIQSSDPMGDFYSGVKTQAEKNAQARLDKENKGKGGGGGASQRDEVAELIKALEQEMAVLKETDPIKKKMLEYSKQLTNATEEQKAVVLGLVVALDQEKNGWAAIGRSLAEFSEESKRIGDDIGEALVGAFQSGEDAVAEFVKSGKLDVADLATSIIADFARIGARRFIFGPLAGALSNAIPGLGNIGANVQHIGGDAGTGPMRQVSAAAFINAPRLHDGTPLGLRADEYAAILQRGERVLNRRQTQEYESGRMGGGTVVNFNGVRDVAGFRQSRTQIAADLGRAVSMGRRGM